MRYFNPFVIFLIALILRLSVVINSHEVPAFDDLHYDYCAMSFLNGSRFSEPAAFKEPFYAFFLAGVYYIFGHNYLIVKIIQAVLGALICIFIFLIGSHLFNRKVGILSGFISGINPSLIKSTEHLLSETLYTFILILTVFLFLSQMRNLKLKNSIALGFLLGIGTLTRSILFPFGVLICLSLFFILYNKYALKKLLSNIFLILVFSVLTILPWSIRNWIVFHEFVPISTNLGINIYSSYFPPQEKLFGFTASDENTEYAKSFNSETKSSKFLMQKTFEKLSKLSPGKILKLELLKIIYFYCPFDWEIIGGGVYNFVYGFILPFFIYGTLLTLKRFRELLPLYLPILCFFITALVTYGSPRFRLPVEPYFIIIASSAIIYFINNAPKKFYPFLITGSYFLCNLIFFTNSYHIKLFVKGFFEKIYLW